MADEGSTAELEEARDFAIARRGYDREQVHEHLEYLKRRILEERRHADELDLQLRHARAELEDKEASYHNLGKDAGRLFEEAGRLAERLREQGQQEAAAVTQSSKAEAQARIEAAEKQASDTEREANRRLAQAQEQAAQVAEDIRASMADSEEQARLQAERIIAEAKTQAAQLIAEAEERRDTIDEEVARLDAHRRQAVEQIRMLSQRLGFVTEPGTDAEPGAEDPSLRGAGAR